MPRKMASAIGVIFVVIAGIGAIRTGARKPTQQDHRVDTPCLPATPEPERRSPT